MAVTLNANTSTGFIATSDTSGVLQLQTGGTTAVTISSGQVATFAQAPVLPAASIPQAALAAGVAGNGPAFSAYNSAVQSIASATYTKILFDTEIFDTNNNFASSRFTPTVAGYYQFNVQSLFFSGVGVGYISFYKNGSIYSNGQAFSLNTSTNLIGSSSCLIFLNGSTDYVEIYCYQSTAGNLSVGSNGSTVQFNGSMVRAA